MESSYMSSMLSLIVNELTAIQLKYGWQFRNDIDWDHISAEEQLSEALIEHFQDSVIWTLISERQILSEEFIEKFQDKVDWLWISICQNLSREFIVKHQKRLDMDNIIRRYKMKINMSNFPQIQEKNNG